MFRKEIINIVRDCRRFAFNKEIDFSIRVRSCSDCVTKMQGFLDLHIISFNEYKLLSRYIYRISDIM